MANENTKQITQTTANEQSEQEKKNALQRFLEALKRFMEWASSLHGNKAIVQQLKELQESTEIAVAQNDILQETVEDLTEIIESFQGQLSTIKEEEVQDVLQKINQITDECEQEAARTISMSKENETSTKATMERFFRKEGIVSSNEEFEQMFANAKVIKRNNESDKYYIAVNQKVVVATASVDGNKPTIFFDKSNYSYDDLFENDKLKDGFVVLEKFGNNLTHTINQDMCTNNNLNYVLDKEKARCELAAKRDAQIKAVKSETKASTLLAIESTQLATEGDIQTKYFPKDNTFRVFNTKTNEMLVIKGKGKHLGIEKYKETNNIDELNGLPQMLVNIEEEDKHITWKNLVTDSKNTDLQMLFQSSLAQEYLEKNGVPKSEQFKMITARRDNTPKVVKFYEAIKAICNRTPENELITNLRHYKGMDIIDIEYNGKNLSIAFRNGEPLDIRYNKAVVCDFQTIYCMPEKDKDFEHLFNIVNKSLEATIGVSASTRSFQLQETKTEKLLLEQTDIGLVEEPTIATEEFKEFTLENLADVFDVTNRGIEKPQNMLKDREYAEKLNEVICKAVHYKNKKIRPEDIEEIAGVNKSDALVMLSDLADLGVIKDYYDRTIQMGMGEYQSSALNLALSPQMRTNLCMDSKHRDYAAYLIDAISNQELSALYSDVRGTAVEVKGYYADSTNGERIYNFESFRNDTITALRDLANLQSLSPEQTTVDSLPVYQVDLGNLQLSNASRLEPEKANQIAEFLCKNGVMKSAATMAVYGNAEDRQYWRTHPDCYGVASVSTINELVNKLETIAGKDIMRTYCFDLTIQDQYRREAERTAQGKEILKDQPLYEDQPFQGRQSQERDDI